MEAPQINQDQGHRLVEVLASMILSAMEWEDEHAAERVDEQSVRQNGLTDVDEALNYTSLETSTGDIDDSSQTEFVTGRSVEKRTEFRLLLDDARNDLYDVLLVDHTSRFGRNQAECIRYKGELQRLGKVVVFVSQGIISGSDRDFLSERINETLDEAYSRNLSRYVREGKARKADAGHALGHPPLGYRSERARSGRGAWAVPDDSTMPALLDLLRGYAGGDHSFKTLAMELNSKGYRTKRGKPFTEGSIRQVLDNPFYSGKFYYHKGRTDEDLRDGVHRVSQEVKDLWARCQEVRRERPTLPSLPRVRGAGGCIL